MITMRYDPASQWSARTAYHHAVGKFFDVRSKCLEILHDRSDAITFLDAKFRRIADSRLAICTRCEAREQR